MNLRYVICSEIIDVRDGTHDSPKYIIDGGYPLITSKNINNNKIDFSNVNYISEEDYIKINQRSEVSNGDIIMPMIGTIGNPVIIDTDKKFAIKNVALFKLANNETILSKYFYYILKTQDIKRQLESNKRGGTQNFVSLKNIRDLKIPLIDILEQKKIVEILDKAQQLIDKRKKQIESLDELVKSKFIEMFGDPVSNPMNWDKKRLADECNIITGNTPSRKVEAYYGDYIEWIKSDNITGAGVYLSTAREYLSKQGLKVGRSIEKDSILMTCIAGSIKCIGNVAIADRKVAFNQQINGIEPLKNNVYFMLQQFNLSQKYIQSTINMSLKGILSKGQLSELEFIFPPIEKQNEFAEFFKQVDKLKFEMEKSLKELEDNFNSLMQKAFKGELFN